MNTLVVYTSKYGSTEKYAKWIAEALGCPAKTLKETSASELAACDTVLYGGGLYAGGIAGFKKFLQKLGQSKPAKLGLFMVGSTNPAQKEVYARVAEQNIPAEWQGRFETFALRGDQLFSKMSGLHKILMRMPKAMAEKKAPEERTEEDRNFIENFGRDVVFSDRGQIEPVLHWLKA